MPSRRATRSTGRIPSRCAYPRTDSRRRPRRVSTARSARSSPGSARHGRKPTAASAMIRPTIWAGHDVDVRFRLHRFAAHIVEHTIQCEKTLYALAWPSTEGRRIARHVAAAIGEVEGLGALADARQLEASLTERFASVKP